jgi:uncharacterized membrane protein
MDCEVARIANVCSGTQATGPCGTNFINGHCSVHKHTLQDRAKIVMDTHHPRSTMTIAKHPIHPMLVPFPIAFFALTLVMDIAYWQTSNLTWKHFAEWLLLAGLMTGALAAIAGAIDLLSRREVRSRPPAWPHAIGNVIVMLLALVNSFVHARDGWTGVVPWGLALSAATVLLLLVTGWLGGSLVYRHGVGVRHLEGREHV